MQTYKSVHLASLLLSRINVLHMYVVKRSLDPTLQSAICNLVSAPQHVTHWSQMWRIFF